ncbi:hydrogenase maturation nickel metallochaperone HypA [Ekhidna sp.]|jgi:hydrogenase nickel incorporation protein HypA/HybF|uniref:hydrogenase maturation nickel metallochaperone HypA/HybF n=1 Tax=Ekhidna sp. TaxID=2608089 RepID=UPI0032EE5669|tara:strand:+ start:2133 stop:2477 length:345 start_codon:yes stop_codon:yes gene_type:complete
MHEISLVRNIFRTLEAEFEKDELEKLSQIDLKVGLLSNVEPILMQNAFEAVTQDEQRFQKAELQVNVVPIIIKCELCGDESEVKNYSFKCSNGHPTKNIIQGEELTIERVHFHE